MKKNYRQLMLLIIASVLSFTTFAQNEQNHKAPRFEILKEKRAVAESADVLRQKMQLTANENYIPQKQVSDNLGMVHTQFQQTYKDLNVEFGRYNIHAKDGLIKSFSGEYFAVGDLDVNPNLTKSQALKHAIAHVGAKQYMWDSPDAAIMQYSKPEGELVIIPILTEKRDAPQMKLAYKFDIYASNPVSRANIYIDANTGSFLYADKIIHHVEATHNNSDLPTGAADTRYSGTRAIQTGAIGSNYRLRETVRGLGIETYNMNTGTNYSAAVDFVDNDNYWSATEYNNLAKDNAALDAHWGAEKTYDYWLLNHGRDSYDDAGAKIRSYVHYASSYNNAYWNGSVMTYGDGSGPGGFDALTAIDVVAHEIGHAVMSNTANLTYSYESGALNESFSDIWGASVEHFTDPTKQHWLIGEEIDMRPGHIALRSMSDPNAEGQPDTYHGTNWYYGSGDNGGVHTNSGVSNYWYYLVSEGGSGVNDNGDSYNVTGIGIDDAAKIAYRTINVYLTPSSQFIDSRTASIQSAIDLFGSGSAAEAAVTDAWCAVGVGPACSSTTSCTSTVSAFPYTESFENTFGLWTQGTGDDFDWALRTGATPSGGTGPSSASVGSFYVYMEASYPNNPYKEAILNSPCFDLSSLSDPTLSFKYHMYGSTMGKLGLFASIDNGATWSNLWTKGGNQGNTWHTANVNLSAYAGTTVIFKFHGITGNGYRSDMAIDGFSISDAIPDACSTVLTSFPYAENFENTFGFWTQDPGNDFDWALRSGGTPSFGTGPSSAASGSYYIYMESSYPNYPYKTAIVNSPCLDLTGMNYAKCKFAYHMYGAANMGKLYLEGSIDGGTTWTYIWAKGGNQGNSWHYAYINLDAFAGNVLILRFRGITGNTWQGDMAVDNFAFNAATFAGIAGIPDETELNTDQDKTQIDNNNPNDVSIYPNPVLDRLNVEFTNESLSDFRIINMVGQTMLNGKVSEKGIDVSNLEKGPYMIELSNSESRLVKRFVKN